MRVRSPSACDKAGAPSAKTGEQRQRAGLRDGGGASYEMYATVAAMLNIEGFTSNVGAVRKRPEEDVLVAGTGKKCIRP